MAERYRGIIAVRAKDRAEWRRWLAAHHTVATRVWLIIYRKESGVPSVHYPEAVEEALCFGWIDSLPNKRDGKSYYLTFSRRKPGSVWSALNKKRVARLIAEKRMRAAGMAMIRLAKRTGTWDALNAIDAMVIPGDLKKLFGKNPAARKNFDRFPPSAKKGILHWITSAKTPATRTRRLSETVTLAARNIRANQYRATNSSNSSL